MKALPLAAFGRSLQSSSHVAYRARLVAAQNELVAPDHGSRCLARSIRWRYTHVVAGLAVVIPRAELGALAALPGVAQVWPNVRYHALRDTDGPQQIGADKLWGANLETAGNGMKIGIIDDGLEATHPYFDPTGFAYPPGFPKGQTALTTPKVIVQRTFAPPSPTYKYANVAVRSDASRSTRRTSPGSPPATTTTRGRHADLRRRAERVPRQLQGAHDPDARLRPRRQQRRDRRRDRGGGRRRHGRDQPLARRAGGRADPRHRRARDRRRSRGRASCR